MRDMDDPLAGIPRQVDLPVPRQIFETQLDIRLFHEAEPQFDADDAAAILIAVEDGHVIAMVMDIGNLGVNHLDENEIAWKNAVAFP